MDHIPVSLDLVGKRLIATPLFYTEICIDFLLKIMASNTDEGLLEVPLTF